MMSDEIVIFFRMKTLIDDHASDAEAMLQDLDSKSFPEVILQLITLKRYSCLFDSGAPAKLRAAKQSPILLKERKGKP